MKKLRCPKCDQFITFDESQYSEGQMLVFECEHCGKQFSIRIVKKASHKDADSQPKEEDLGVVTALENVFGFKQEFKLVMGDNVFGRRCKGTVINQPIQTSDRSIDRIHCIIHVDRNAKGELVYTLRDAPSITGTFYMNEILEDKDRVRIQDGAIITIGALTMILHTAQ
jgi:DNA-directed RNA polymerase subunit M/transcription elongation factor TFIIS